MTEHAGTDSSDEEKSKKTGGGAAFGGGANFQSSLTAIVATHILTGSPLGWLDGVCDDRPAAVWAESEGPGDDLRVELIDGNAIEVQAKKGLTRGADLWSALMALAKAINDGALSYGILALASDASASIRQSLANDIERLGQGRIDNLHNIGQEFHQRLVDDGLSVSLVCRALRIRVIDTLIAKNGDINAAKNSLRLICHDENDGAAAFDILGFRALRLIENRGRWTLRDLVQLLRTRGIKLRDHSGPAALLDRFSRWVSDSHKNFSIPGVPKKISIEHLLPMKLEARPFEQEAVIDAQSALERYQKVRVRQRSFESFDAKWTGRFKPRAVVVAGPGLGKSTLLRELAHQYSLDGFMVLCAPLKWIAAGLRQGRAFSDLLATKAFDGSGLRASEVMGDARFNLVILLDALDECGEEHNSIAEHIHRFALGHPKAKIIVTTRPIGYTSSALSEWTHYNLLPPAAEDAPKNLRTLLEVISPAASGIEIPFFKPSVLGRRQEPVNGFDTSPQLLGLSAALIYRNQTLPTTRVQLYSELITLLESAPISVRAFDGADLTDIAIQVLNMTGWRLLENPLLPLNQLIAVIAADLSPLIGSQQIACKGYARAALSHWERVGLVETLHHDGTQLIAFIHKTFCEFVAARYLSEQSVAMIDGVIDRDGLDELINFGVGLGLADKLIEIYLRRAADGMPNVIAPALALLTKPGARASTHNVQRLIQIAFDSIDDQDTHAFSIGLGLASFGGDAADLVEDGAVKRLYAMQSSVRVIAWGLAGHLASSDLDVLAILRALALTIPEPERTSITKELKVRGHGLELLRRLALNLLKAQPDSQASSFAAQLCGQTFSTMGFREDVNAHLSSRGVAEVPSPLDGLDVSQNSVALARFDWVDSFSGMDAFVAIAKALAGTGNPLSLASPRSPALPQFSAFLNASGFMNCPASDVEAWGDSYDEDVVRSTLTSIASDLPLDMDELQRECSEILNLYISGKGSLFDVMADVDISSWSIPVPSTAPRNLHIVQQGLLHPSEWFCHLCLQICAPFPMAADDLKGMLQVANDHSLGAVLFLIETYHPSQLIDLAVRRLLRDTSPRQVSPIFTLFVKWEVMPTPQLQDVVMMSLCSDCWNTAREATNLLDAWVTKGMVLDRDKIEAAVEHWGGRKANQAFKPPPLQALISLSDRIADGG
ncbi:hypothetical protein V2K57_12520 [Pseudomonas alliivorans]|nr:hypothetical protein [Pseudomonas alliivorans]MEE4701269.1 hypothetical protein [Pseudomonas alliivorans]MEE4737197.1 hypothetical protein [Pseudomonas alliivorans]